MAQKAEGEMVQISKTDKTPSLSKRNDIYYTYKLTLHKYHERAFSSAYFNVYEIMTTWNRQYYSKS